MIRVKMVCSKPDGSPLDWDIGAGLLPGEVPLCCPFKMPCRGLLGTLGSFCSGSGLLGVLGSFLRGSGLLGRLGSLLSG